MSVRNNHINWLDQLQWAHINHQIENFKDKSRQSDIEYQIWSLQSGLLILVSVLFCLVLTGSAKIAKAFVQGMLNLANQRQLDRFLSDKFPCNETIYSLEMAHSFLSLCLYSICLLFWHQVHLSTRKRSKFDYFPQDLVWIRLQLFMQLPFSCFYLILIYFQDFLCGIILTQLSSSQVLMLWSRLDQSECCLLLAIVIGSQIITGPKQNELEVENIFSWGFLKSGI